MKTPTLKNLITAIVHQLMEELDKNQLQEFSLSSSDMTKISNDSNVDPSTPPQDAMTSIEKAKLDREQEHNRQQQIKDKELELRTAKSELSFQTKKTDQQKRVGIPTLNKDIQRLKGAQI